MTDAEFAAKSERLAEMAAEQLRASTKPLTEDHIRTLTAGPELDHLIATLVMAQERVSSCALGSACCPGKYAPQVGAWPCLPPYSSSIAAAWQVVERMQADGWKLRLTLDPGCPVHIAIWRLAPDEVAVGYQAETLPLVVCRGVLLARGGT